MIPTYSPYRDLRDHVNDVRRGIVVRLEYAGVKFARDNTRVDHHAAILLPGLPNHLFLVAATSPAAIVDAAAELFRTHNERIREC